MPTTTVSRSFWSRNRWALPTLLALLIAVVVLGAIFGSKLKNLASSSTATPMPSATAQKVVVTATPGGPTPTPGGPTATPGGPTATPGGPATPTPSGSTPLPHTTLVPTVPGLKLGMITYPANQVQAIQSGADTGTGQYVYHLDPIKVVNTDLPHYGFQAGAFKIVQPTTANPTPTAFAGPDGRPLVKCVVQYQGKYYQVQVVQPGTHGPKGIWLLVSIIPGTA